MKSTGEPSAPASAIPSSSRCTAAVTAGSSAATRRAVKTEAISERARPWSGALRSSIERLSRTLDRCRDQPSSHCSRCSASGTPKPVRRSVRWTSR